jgi:uncharacterized protein (TIGR03000 family)
MFRILTAVGFGPLLVALFLGGAAPRHWASGAPGGEERPAQLEVRLPADALLEIGAAQTRATGARRVFQTPPLRAGRTFTYLLKATWQGKVAVHSILVKAGELSMVEFTPADFQVEGAGAGQKPAVAEEGKAVGKGLPMREGFVTLEHDGRWWVFRAESKDLAAFRAKGESEKHVVRINAPPWKVTLKAPDIATLEEYLATKPGFVIRYEDARLWIFRKGSKQLAHFDKHGELTQHVIRTGAGPRGMTLKAPDRETMDAYLKAPAE